MKSKRSPFNMLATTTLVMAFSAVSTQAASQTWTNSASDLQWNASSTNWTGVAWTNNNDAVFGATGVGSIAVASGVIVNDITFDTTGYTLTGNLMLANDQASTFTLNADETISAVIANNTAGASSLTKAGNSKLTLSGANTYSGGTTLSAGTLSIGASSTPTSGTVTSGPLGTGALTLSGGTLNFNGGSFTVANAIAATASSTTTVQTASGQNEVLNGNLTGSGNLNHTANGTTGQLQWGGDNSGYSGTYTQGSGNTSLAFNAATAGSASANWVFNNGTSQRTRFNFGTGTINFGSLSGTGNIANVFGGTTTATMSVGDLDTNTTFSGVIADNGNGNIAVTKVGNGTLTLSGTNTYDAGTTVSSGTLTLAKGGSAGAIRGTLTINSGGTVTTTATDALGFSAGTSVTQLNINGGTLDIASAGNQGYLADVSLTGGNLTSTGGGTFNINGKSITSIASATTSLISSGITLRSGLTSTITVADGAAAIDLNITGGIGQVGGTGGITKAGDGTLQMTGANTYTGATTINSGTLALGSTGSIDNTSGVSLGTVGTFDVAAKGIDGYTVNNLTGSGDVTGALTVSTQLAIGTVNFSSNLTLGSISTYTYELTGGSNTADLGDVAGDLTITAGAILDLVQLGTYTPNDKFTLFAYGGALSGTFTGLADGATFTDAGGIWMIDYNDTTAGLNGGTGINYITVTAVPEPAAALLCGLGMLILLRRRRH